MFFDLELRAMVSKYSEAEYESHNNKVIPDGGEHGWVNK